MAFKRVPSSSVASDGRRKGRRTTRAALAVRGVGAGLVLPAALVGTIALSGPSTTGPVTASAGDLGRIEKVNSTYCTNNIVADFTAGRGTTWSGQYGNVINQIRLRVTNGNLRAGIMRERAATTNDYFYVDFRQNGTPRVAVVFNAANLYVEGYWNHATNTYIRLNAGPWNPVGARTVNNQFLTAGDYTYLERVGGFDRSQRRLGMGSFYNDLSTLGNGRALNSVAATQRPAQAQAITDLIQMFAEGARFDFISSNIQTSAYWDQVYTAGTEVQLRGDGNTPIGINNPRANAVDFENVWGQLSRYTRAVLALGGAINFRVNAELVLTTMQGIANQLAVSYMG